MNCLPCQIEVITERKREQENASIPNTLTVLQGNTNRNNASWMTSYPCLSAVWIWLYSHFIHSLLERLSIQRQCGEFGDMMIQIFTKMWSSHQQQTGQYRSPRNLRLKLICQTPKSAIKIILITRIKYVFSLEILSVLCCLVIRPHLVFDAVFECSPFILGMH